MLSAREDRKQEMRGGSGIGVKADPERANTDHSGGWRGNRVRPQTAGTSNTLLVHPTFRVLPWK